MDAIRQNHTGDRAIDPAHVLHALGGEPDLVTNGSRAACLRLQPDIVPLHGIVSRTKLYRVFYKLLGPVLPLLSARFPRYVTTTEQIGRAMLKVAKQGWPKRVLETPDINLA